MNSSLASPKSASAGIPLERQREVTVAHTGVLMEAFQQRAVDAVRAEHLGERVCDLRLGVSVRGQGA